MLGSRLGLYFPMILSLISRWKMRIEETESVRHIDDVHASFALLLYDLVPQRLHSRPMHLWPEVMFCVVAVVEPRPVINLAICAHAPGDWLVRIATVVAVIAVQI